MQIGGRFSGGRFSGGRFGAASQWTPAHLATGGTIAPYWSVLKGAWQDAGGTIPADAEFDRLALLQDQSGGGVDAAQPVIAQQPVRGEVQIDGRSYAHTDHGFGDSLPVPLPDMGTDATEWVATPWHVVINDGLTIGAGARDLPKVNWSAMGLVNRALTLSEKNKLLRHLSRKGLTSARYATLKTRMDAVLMNVAAKPVFYDRANDTTPGTSVYLIVPEATAVKLYDATDLDLPLVKTFDFTGYTVSGIAAAEQYVVVGTASGVAQLDIVNDTSVSITYSTGTTPAIVSNTVKDVAIAVLAGDTEPTIAVATAGGGSIIRADGGVSNGATVALSMVRFDGSQVWFHRSGTNEFYVASDYSGSTFTSVLTYAGAADQLLTGAQNDFIAGDLFASATDTGLTLKSDGLTARVTNTYNTGWVADNTVLAALCGTETGDLVGGTVLDRSPAGNHLTVHGTLQRTPVAEGAEAVWIEGLNGTNYITAPFMPEFDVGSGDFFVRGWFWSDFTANPYVMDRATSTGDGRFYIFTHTSGTALASPAGTVGGLSIPSNQRVFLAFGRKDGRLFAQVNDTYVLGPLSGYVINDAAHAPPLVIGQRYTLNGSMERVRSFHISTTAPSAAQIAQIYADELEMFDPAKAITLAGSGPQVNALDAPGGTGLIYAGQSDKISIFRGLVRDGALDLPCTTGIAVHDGQIAVK